MKHILFLIAALFAHTLYATGAPISFNLELRQANKAAPPTLFFASNIWAWDANMPLEFRPTKSSGMSCDGSGTCSAGTNVILPKDLSTWEIVLDLMELTKNNQLGFPEGGPKLTKRFKRKNQIQPSDAEGGFYSIPSSVKLQKGCYHITLEVKEYGRVTRAGPGTVCLQ